MESFVDTTGVDVLKDGAPIDDPPVQKQLLNGIKSSQDRKPMRVIILGMPGTNGPNTIRALKQLGIENIFETSDLLHPKYAKEHARLIRMQTGETRKHRELYYTADDFDPILKNHQAVIGWPAAAYATDLMIAYREAKVIFTTIPASTWPAWQKKLEATYNTLQSSPLIKFLLWTNVSSYRSTHALLMIMFQNLFDGDIARHGIMSYKIHMGRVTGTLNLQHRSGSTDLVFFDPSRDGWSKLCEFLTIPTPNDVTFPRACHYNGSGNAIDSDPAFKQLAPWRLFIRYCNYNPIFACILACFLDYLLIKYSRPSHLLQFCLAMQFPLILEALKRAPSGKLVYYLPFAIVCLTISPILFWFIVCGCCGPLDGSLHGALLCLLAWLHTTLLVHLELDRLIK